MYLLFQSLDFSICRLKILTNKLFSLNYSLFHLGVQAIGVQAGGIPTPIANKIDSLQSQIDQLTKDLKKADRRVGKLEEDLVALIKKRTSCRAVKRCLRNFEVRL